MPTREIQTRAAMEERTSIVRSRILCDGWTLTTLIFIGCTPGIPLRRSKKWFRLSTISFDRERFVITVSRIHPRGTLRAPKQSLKKKARMGWSLCSSNTLWQNAISNANISRQHRNSDSESLHGVRWPAVFWLGNTNRREKPARVKADWKSRRMPAIRSFKDSQHAIGKF